MPRPPRADEAGGLYHALNRGNSRSAIFRKEADFEAFEKILAEGLERFKVQLFAYQLMPNHWHLVLRPLIDGEMSRFLRWVSGTHTMRYHAHYHTSGQGHVYQGRYKSFPIQEDEHFLTVCRYVERNALRAQLVRKAQDWRWGSLWRWLQKSEPDPPLLSPWPIPRGANQRGQDSLFHILAPVKLCACPDPQEPTKPAGSITRSTAETPAPPSFVKTPTSKPSKKSSPKAWSALRSSYSPTS